MDNNNNNSTLRIRLMNIILLVFNIIYYVYIFGTIKAASFNNQWTDIQERPNQSTFNFQDNKGSFVFITIVCLIGSILFLIMSINQKKKIVNIFLSVLNILIDSFILFILITV